jgi:hypothetical protein
MSSEHWPLFDLIVRTPRVELHYPNDDDVDALADLAARGIHDPTVMPFLFPWTDVAPPLQQRNTLQALLVATRAVAAGGVGPSVRSLG